MTQLDTTPTSADMGSSEILPFSWDFSLNVNITGGETISTATMTLTDTTNNSNYTQGLSGGTSINGAVVTQTIVNTVAGHKYSAVCKIVTSLGRTWQARTVFVGVL